MTTGQGLSVLISCECTQHHNWMAFACWSSLQKNLPDAQVAIVCTRALGGNFFIWTKQCKVPFCYHAEQEGPRKLWQAQVALRSGMVNLPLLILDPDVLAVRELHGEMDKSAVSANDKVWFLKDSVDKPLCVNEDLCKPARGEDFVTFVEYAEGWGKFVTPDCINRRDYPFRRAERFHSGSGMTLNEVKVLDLWKRMDRLFTAVSRG